MVFSSSGVKKNPMTFDPPESRKSIASFKLREGMPIGVKVTLRRKNMYEFLDRLISLALPKVRDFQGITSKFDGRGSYNLGVKEWIIFPETDYDVADKLFGMNITIQGMPDADGNTKGFMQVKAIVP